MDVNVLLNALITAYQKQDYTPLALYNEDPSGVQVGIDAPWSAIDELLAYVKDNPAGTLKAFDALGRPLGLLLEDLQLGTQVVDEALAEHR